MYQEFFFTPKALRNATIIAARNGLIQLLSLVSVYFLLFQTELSWPDDFENIHIYLFLLFLALSIYMIPAARQRHLRCRFYVTPEGLHFKRGATELKISLDELSKVQYRSSDYLIIYSKKSSSIPALALANLDKHEEFIEIMKPYVPIVMEEKLPWRLNPWIKMITNYLFFSFLLVIVFFHSLFWILVAGIPLLLAIGYSLFVQLVFRKQVLAPATLISLSLMLFTVFLKIAFTLYMHWHY